MKKQDEDSLSNLNATNSGDGDVCVRCGTSYTSYVEFTQHLLLHIERFDCSVLLDRNEAENYRNSNSSTSESAMETENKIEENQPNLSKIQQDDVNDHPDEVEDEEVETDGAEEQLEQPELQKPAKTVNGENEEPTEKKVKKEPTSTSNKKEESAKNGNKTDTISLQSSPHTSLNGDDSKPTSTTCKTELGAENESPLVRPSSAASLPGITIRKFEDLIGDSKYKLIEDCAAESQNGEFPSKDFFTCPLCPQRFMTQAELETHAAAAGHIVCTLSESCANLSFDSSTALSAHQQTTHPDANRSSSNAVQQLAAQVDRLPQTFNQYVPQQQFAPPAFNAPKLGAGVVLTPASAMAPAPSPHVKNLPAGTQIMKRPAQDPLLDVSPSKAPRNENGASPRFRLPDSITLVKGGQPQPSLSPAVANTANQLASRGITMMASGSRSPSQGPPAPAATIQSLNNSPAKRIPAGISIFPSRSANQQPGQQQRYQQSPPVGRGPVGRPSATVDLTKDDLNGPARQVPRGRPMMAPAAPLRRVSCTICDKVFPSNEALNQHMVVHGRGGLPQPAQQRFICPVCQVSYTSEAKLLQHKRASGHGMGRQPMVQPSSTQDFALPVVDLNQPGTRERLLNCGIRHSIKLTSLRNANNNAVFALPIIPIDLAQNEAFSRLEDLGASNLLSLGSLLPINTQRR